MKTTLLHNGNQYTARLSEPLDISIPMGEARCFYAPKVTMEPFRSGDFIGSVRHGAPVNFYNVSLNPHGNGTHTECCGHITKNQESINSALKSFHHVAKLVTIKPVARGKNDKVITVTALRQALNKDIPAAVIIRTKPNRQSKRTRDYSGTNPPYVDKRAMQYLVDNGVQHLLIDLPSVDREVDKGVLAAHHIFWKLGPSYGKSELRNEATITELIFVDNTIKDGLYLVNLQICALELDAAPSKPVLYQLHKNIEG